MAKTLSNRSEKTNFETEDKWYAVHTKTSQEDIAAFNLSRLELEILNPKLQQEKLVWGCPKSVIKPLFPGYLFAKFNPAKYLHIIQYARGVKQVLRFGMSLIPVDEEIIQGIRARLNAKGYAEIQKDKIVAGSFVSIQEGAFSGLNGIFERELSDQRRVVVLLDLMGVNAQVVIGKQFIKSAA